LDPEDSVSVGQWRCMAMESWRGSSCSPRQHLWFQLAIEGVKWNICSNWWTPYQLSLSWWTSIGEGTNYKEPSWRVVKENLSPVKSILFCKLSI
jgi:hypothetical protein